MAELEVLPADADVEVVADVLDRDGGVIVRDLLDAEAIDRIVADLEPSLLSTPLNPLLLAVADHCLLPWAADYWLNTGQVMAVGPGERAQYVHRDQNNWPEALDDERELTVSCMFALNEFTEENGMTVVVPGSHTLPCDTVLRGATFDPDELAHAEMPPGSGLIYTGKVAHGAGPNATDGWRYGMHVSFVVGWLRPEEASPLVVDRELAAELPVRARQLLGWGSYHSDGGGRTWLVDFEDASRLFE